MQYIPRNMHTVFALLCFVVVIHWLIFPYPSGLRHWHCGNLTIAPVPAKQPWWIWINTSCEFIMNDCITTTKQSTTKPCAYFLGHTVSINHFEYELQHKPNNGKMGRWHQTSSMCCQQFPINYNSKIFCFQNIRFSVWKHLLWQGASDPIHGIHRVISITACSWMNGVIMGKVSFSTDGNGNYFA